MKNYKVTIESITPYMQHRMDDIALDAWEKQRGAIIENGHVHQPDEKRAMYHSYINDNGQYFIPVEQIRQACINSGGLMKSKVGNARKSMKNIVAAMFFFSPEQLPLPKFDQIDKRTAINKNVKARVITIRPKWSTIRVNFSLSIDNDTITDDTVQKIIEDAGNYIGIGSYRPTNNGSFGRFKVTEFKNE